MRNLEIYTFSTGLLALILLMATSCQVATVRDAPAPKEPAVTVREIPADNQDEKDGEPRRRAMVLPFVDLVSGRSERTSTLARQAFIKALRRSNDFVLVEPSDFPKDIKLYLRGGEYELESMSKQAAGLGLAIIIEGKVLNVKAKRLSDEIGLVREVRAKLEASVQIRVVSTKNSHVIFNETRSAVVEESTTRYAERVATDKDLEQDPELIEAVVAKAFLSTVPKIAQSVDKLAWEGRVAMVKGDRIYLNAGRLSGLQPGDILKVTEEGEDVYDPETGSMVGRVPGRLKGTIEVVSYFGKDGAIAIVHSGSGFRENDLVEIY